MVEDQISKSISVQVGHGEGHVREGKIGLGIEREVLEGRQVCACYRILAVIAHTISQRYARKGTCVPNLVAGAAARLTSGITSCWDGYGAYLVGRNRIIEPITRDVA